MKKLTAKEKLISKAKRLAYHREWQKANRDKSRKGNDYIACKICGRKFVQIGSHIVQMHGYERARDYRVEYGYDVKRGMLPKKYRELKAQQARENGTIDNLKKGKRYRFKKGDKEIGRYERSEETLNRLKKQGKMLAEKFGYKRR